jgi:predicted  nucleic acid-binding Zn-ribbon protein
LKLDENFKLILTIQSTDARIEEITREMEGAPKRIQRLKDDLDLLEKSVEQDLSSLEDLKKGSPSLERDLEEVELKLKKSKVKLNDVKSNKEYQAVLKEIEELNELTFQKEELVIKWMEEIEIQEKECADNNERWERSRKEYESEEKKFSQRMKELEKEVQSLDEQRLKLCREVDKDLLSRYTALKAHLRSQVVVPVIDAVCGGCHLGIPPQQYNDLIRGGSLQSCPNCNRIIYFEENKNP